MFLKELGLTISAECAISDRRSTLNIETLKAKKNSDLREAMANAHESCTDMGERAARIAIERAGITVEQIGLVIGDCSTPIEVTPAEAQRVGGRLGLKVPAYDIYTTSGICPGHLAVLSTWKKERLPKYILCLSTNAPTQRVDYQTNNSLHATFSDGASACVISAEDTRGLRVLSYHFGFDSKRLPRHELDTLGNITSKPTNTEDLRAQAKAVFERLVANAAVAANPDRLKIFWSVGDAALAGEVAQAFGFKREQLVNDFSLRGDMLGSTPFYALAERWQALSPDSLVAVVVADGGVQSGYVTFQVHREG